MEWVLQVVDEVDDVCSALRHGWLGIAGETGVFVLACVATAAAVAALAGGADPALIGASLVMANVAALLEMRGTSAARAPRRIL